MERQEFTIKSILEMKKVLEMFNHLLDRTVNVNISNNDVTCDGCNNLLQTTGGNTKCFCGKYKAIISCPSSSNCRNFICLRCGNIISILQKIMINAVHVRTAKSALNEIKKDALKIELLRSKKLF